MDKNVEELSPLLPKAANAKVQYSSEVKLEASLDMNSDIIPKMREQHFQQQWLSIPNHHILHKQSFPSALPQKESRFIFYFVKQKETNSMATLGMTASIEITSERKCEGPS